MTANFSNLGIDWAQVDEEGSSEKDSFEPMPEGDYLAIVSDSEGKQTNGAKGPGYGIKLEFTVVEGNFKNRKLWDFINLANPSSQCANIGRAKYKSLNISLGLGEVPDNDSSKLHNKPVTLTVTRKYDANFGMQNKITGFAPPDQAPRTLSPTGEIAEGPWGN